MRRWLIFAPVAILSVFSPATASAEPEYGLNARGYSIDEIPPTRSDDIYPSCGSEIENNINRNFNGEPFQSCGDDYFMVHYEGFITIPEHETIRFAVAADDGGTVSIAGQEFGTWNVKGCSWSSVATLSIASGVHPLDGWFFEAGGGTCFMLIWQIDDGGWEIVPDSAFTTLPYSTTTTTVEESTTTSATTTTSSSVPESSSSSSSSSSSVPETSSSVSSSSVVETSVQQSSSTTSTIPDEPSTTTTLHDFVPETAIPTEQAPTPQQPAPENTVQETTTTEVLTEDTAFVQDTVVEDTIPVDESPVDESLPPIEIIGDEESASDTTLPPLEDDATSPPDTLGSDMSVVEPEDDQSTSEYTAEQVSEAINSITNNDPSEITTEQVEILTSPEVFEQLTESQLEAVVETLSSASDEVKELFEESIDVFSGKVDNYVPLGSNISVGKRRVLNAVTATLFVMSAPIPVASASASAKRQ